MNSKQVAQTINQSNVASLLLCCADQVGIIASLLGDLFYANSETSWRHGVLMEQLPGAFEVRGGLGIEI